MLQIELMETKETLKLKQSVLHSIESHWSEHKTPILLAQLGFMDNGEISNQLSKLELGLNLKQFIETYLDEVATIQRDTMNKAIIGVMPTKALEKHPSAFDLLFKTIKDNKITELKKPRKFSQFIWIAFRKELKNGYSRYVSLEPDGEFYDIKLGAAVPAQTIEICNDELSSEKEKAVATAHKIENWAKKNDLELESLLLNETTQPSSLLSTILDVLSDADLKRISIPLDIIKKLNGKP